MNDTTPHFEGNVDTRWLVHGCADREMERITDQAWSTVVGTPFVGDYRRASVVHDVACEHHEKTSREAHRMFYEAMLADGTEEARALLFYTAVHLFGPQWDQQCAFRPMLAHRAQDIDFDRLEPALDDVIDTPAAPPRSGPSSKGRRPTKTAGTKKRRRAGGRR